MFTAKQGKVTFKFGDTNWTTQSTLHVRSVAWSQKQKHTKPWPAYMEKRLGGNRDIGKRWTRRARGPAG